MSSETDGERYEFAFDHRLLRPLALLGIRPSTCGLVIASDELLVRFGPWRVRTTLDNVAGAEVTGPYQAWKAIGVRVSWADRGLTFGTGTERGVCVRFHRPVPGAEPTGRLRHPGLTLTLADPSAVADRLQGAVSAPR
ncbi:hypothetical protein [Actinomadura spongiicola]|uniref:hypothetical protein n=1 Tax=Actinomadura spongiicola TaxID=2303421 RepID=UPI0018F1A1CB|nr:hypothetical protein [Actinomadura spongiicola]